MRNSPESDAKDLKDSLKRISGFCSSPYSADMLKKLSAQSEDFHMTFIRILGHSERHWKKAVKISIEKNEAYTAKLANSLKGVQKTIKDLPPEMLKDICSAYPEHKNFFDELALVQFKLKHLLLHKEFKFAPEEISYLKKVRMPGSEIVLKRKVHLNGHGIFDTVYEDTSEFRENNGTNSFRNFIIRELYCLFKEYQIKPSNSQIIKIIEILFPDSPIGDSHIPPIVKDISLKTPRRKMGISL